MPKSFEQFMSEGDFLPRRRGTLKKSTPAGHKRREDDKESKSLKNKQKTNHLSNYTGEKGLPSRISTSKKRKEEDEYINDLFADSDDENETRRKSVLSEASKRRTSQKSPPTEQKRSSLKNSSSKNLSSSSLKNSSSKNSSSSSPKNSSPNSSSSSPNSSSKKGKRSEEKVEKSSHASRNVEDKSNIKEEGKKSPAPQYTIINHSSSMKMKIMRSPASRNVENKSNPKEFVNTNKDEKNVIDMDELLAESDDENEGIVHTTVYSEEPLPSFECHECRKTVEDRLFDHYVLFHRETMKAMKIPGRFYLF